MPNVLILRGIPGCGKTTYAKTFSGATVVSADDFFLTKTGDYKYDRAQIEKAHAQCLRKFVTALQEGHKTVIVDNTNLAAIDIAPYYILALAFDYEAEIITLLCDPKIAAARNVHEVPPEIVEQKQRALLAERLPKRWRQRVVKNS